MYNHRLRVHGEYLAKDQSLPKGKAEECNFGSRRSGSFMGATEIIIQANTQVSCVQGSKIELSIYESSDNITFKKVPVIFSLNLKEKTTWEVGEEIGKLPLPSDCKSYIKGELSTTDNAAKGIVDVFFSYLPR